MRRFQRTFGVFEWWRCWKRLTTLLLLMAVSGCQALDRMDYLDRFFEPSAECNPCSALEGPTVSALPATANLDAGRGHSPTTAPPPDAVSPTPSQGSQPKSSPRRGSGSQPVPSPQPNAEENTRLAVRQHRWLMQSWSELTSAQQIRIERQLHRGSVDRTAERTEPAAIWDTMGLADRIKLNSGNGQLFENFSPTEPRSKSIWAGNP